MSIKSSVLQAMAVPCATPHCPGQAPRRCLKPDGEQLCGNCCSCAGHGRRSQRGGPHAGIRTAERLEERNTFQREYRVLKEAPGGLRCNRVAATNCSKWNTTHPLLCADDWDAQCRQHCCKCSLWRCLFFHEKAGSCCRCCHITCMCGSCRG